MTESTRYYGETYCCPACGVAFTLVRKEITGCGPDTERQVLRCPACSADTAVCVSDEELVLVTSYVKLRHQARELIRTRTTRQTTKKLSGDRL